MIIGGRYSFNNGEQFLQNNFSNELQEVENIIASVNAQLCKNKKSQEKTKPGQVLYSPAELNKAFKQEFELKKWHKKRVICDYQKYNYYTHNFSDSSSNKKTNAYREMDFLKNQVGVEVQFGKYAFMAYNVCAKMTIFKNLGYIEAGIEVVPLKQLADEMSTGVSYFEQIVWDLETRGVANIDIPVLVLGIAA